MIISLLDRHTGKPLLELVPATNKNHPPAFGIPTMFQSVGAIPTCNWISTGAWRI